MVSAPLRPVSASPKERRATRPFLAGWVLAAKCPITGLVPDLDRANSNLASRWMGETASRAQGLLLPSVGIVWPSYHVQR
jgi:hypothetical protein